MWLQCPKRIDNVLWEGALEPAAGEKEIRIKRSSFDPGDMAVDYFSVPVISIGKPEIWSLPDVYYPEQLPRLLELKLIEFDFFLVRLACSFRPERNEHIEWARLLVHLLPDEDRRQPIAYDLHPLMVTQEVKRNVRVTISPALKFQETEAKLGELSFGLEYPELHPVISAAGAGESVPSWDYRKTKGMIVQGAKWMHILLSVPREMRTVRIFLDLVADVQEKGFVIPAFLFSDQEQAESHMTVTLISR